MAQSTVADGRGARPVVDLMIDFSQVFWSGPNRRKAWLLTSGAFGFELANIGMQLAVNYWNRAFFDALDKRAADAMWSTTVLFPVLALLAAAAVVGAVTCKALLQINWRARVTDELSDRWLSNHAFYRLNVLRGAEIAPEHRIAEDVRQTIEPIVDLIIGFTNAILTFVAFVGVLWVVGGSAVIGGNQIPGFMVFAALAYAIVAGGVMLVAGAPYAQTVRDRNEAEARFRFELTRIRENAESIAMSNGRQGERARLSGYFGDVVTRWSQMTWVWGRMTWVAHTNNIVSPVVPLLLMAPKYLAGDASLGIVMQATAAFVSVQAAAGWFTANFAKLSEWYASATRVAEIGALIERAGNIPGSQRIDLGISPDGDLHLSDVSIALHSGRALVADAELRIKPGEMVMVIGESGTGKSSLIRAIAGLWPWGSGRILLPAGARTHFLPQRPYLPNGTLEQAISYPKPAGSYPAAELADVLRACMLDHLVPRLGDNVAWDKELSGGEQQRVAFARMLLAQPNIAILDEATSALDEIGQAQLMELFRFRLSGTMVISVAHRPSLGYYHSRHIVLRRDLNGATVNAMTTEQGSFTRMRLAWTALAEAGMPLPRRKSIDETNGL